MSQDSNNSGNNFLSNLSRIAFDPNMFDFSSNMLSQHPELSNLSRELFTQYPGLTKSWIQVQSSIIRRANLSTNLKKENEKLKAEITGLKTKNEDLEKTNIKLKEENKNLNSKIDTLEKKIKSIEDEKTVNKSNSQVSSNENKKSLLLKIADVNKNSQNEKNVRSNIDFSDFSNENFK